MCPKNGRLRTYPMCLNLFSGGFVMAHYPFDPKELDFTRRAMSFNPAVPGNPIFNFPVSEREALLSLYNNKEAIWMPYKDVRDFIYRKKKEASEDDD